MAIYRLLTNQIKAYSVKILTLTFRSWKVPLGRRIFQVRWAVNSAHISANSNMLAKNGWEIAERFHFLEIICTIPICEMLCEMLSTETRFVGTQTELTLKNMRRGNFKPSWSLNHLEKCWRSLQITHRVKSKSTSGWDHNFGLGYKYVGRKQT